MTLPIAPQCWDIDELTVDRTQAIAAFGFTERQARFLVTVMLHSGVFVERQYCAFAGIVHGQKTHDFLERLTARGMAKAIAVGPLHRGRLFHVHHKPLYAAIGQIDNRHRKPMSTGRMIERLMVLDAVLDDGTFTWLATEFDKRSYFIRELGKDLALKEYPRLTFGEGTRQTVRLFPDKMPVGIQRGGRDHRFLYLVTRPDPMDFRGVPVAAGGAAAKPAPMDNSCARTAAVCARDSAVRPCGPHTRGAPAALQTSSAVLKDKLERREGRFEFLPLSRQYLHLSSLVGVA